MIHDLHQANAAGRRSTKRPARPSVKFHTTAKDFCTLAHSIVPNAHGWQRQIADLVGVSPPQIGRWACGTRTPDKAVVFALWMISPFGSDRPIDIRKIQSANCFAIVGGQSAWYWTDLFNQTPGAARFRHQHAHGTILPKRIRAPTPRLGKTVIASPEISWAPGVPLKA